MTLYFTAAEIVFGEVESNFNDQYIYPVQFSRSICLRRKRNKTGVVCRVFAILFTNSSKYDYVNNLANPLEIDWKPFAEDCNGKNDLKDNGKRLRFFTK